MSFATLTNNAHRLCNGRIETSTGVFLIRYFEWETFMNHYSQVNIEFSGRALFDCLHLSLQRPTSFSSFLTTKKAKKEFTHCSPWPLNSHESDEYIILFKMCYAPKNRHWNRKPKLTTVFGAVFESQIHGNLAKLNIFNAEKCKSSHKMIFNSR